MGLLGKCVISQNMLDSHLMGLVSQNMLASHLMGLTATPTTQPYIVHFPEIPVNSSINDL